jgi:phospholipid/cholesterol/gamma-HCH transport system ATP-binding protein
MKRRPEQTANKEKVIFIKGLYKSFGENHVLRGIDLDVYKGENVVVLGRSGTGKSVLIKIIAGLLMPDKGQVNVLGMEVEALTKEELRTLRLKLGFSFQNSALYDSMTVKENLEFPLVRNSKSLSRAEVNNAVETVLDAVGLSQTINQMPSRTFGRAKKTYRHCPHTDFAA